MALDASRINWGNVTNVDLSRLSIVGKLPDKEKKSEKPKPEDKRKYTK